MENGFSKMSTFDIPISLLTGVKHLDGQHQEIVCVAFCLQDYIGEDHLREALYLFDRFIRLLYEHFRDEEGLMAETCFREIESHQKHHETIGNRTKEIRAEIQEQGRVEKGHVVECVDGILVHMFKSDASFHTHLCEIGFCESLSKASSG